MVHAQWKVTFDAVMHVQGARIRHRMRQRACKALCSEILEIHHMTEGLNEADSAPDADLRKTLKQHVRTRR